MFDEPLGVLVTGGSRGIGKATAAAFLGEGCRVFLCGVETEEVESAVAHLVQLGPCAGAQADISDQEAVKRVVSEADEWLGGIDVLINNAGVAEQTPFLDIELDSWRRILDVNLTGTFLMSQQVAQRMVDNGNAGVILNMSSTNGLAGEVDYAHYNASKGGVTLLTKTLALELGPKGIRVNAVCPGYIQTPLARSLHSEQFVRDYIENRIPIGRVGTPEDVAEVFVFLASSKAGFIHGATVVVDGGQLAG